MKTNQKTSIKGRDFKGNPLNENTIGGGIKVLWRNKTYLTGNRYKDIVELFSDGKFIRTVSAKHIYLIEP